MNRWNRSSIVLTLVLAGCEVPEVEDASTGSPPQATSVAQDPAVQPPVAQSDSRDVPTSNPESPNPNEPPAVTNSPREVSDLDPAKGKKSRAAGGYLGAVAGARFYAEHSLIFDQVRHALNLYWAEKGEYPKSHEEFMERIVQANQIQLPALDPGVEYIYDPEDHKLKVWRPEAPDQQPSAIEQN